MGWRKSVKKGPGIWVWEKIPALSGTWYTRFFFCRGVLDVPEMARVGETAFGGQLREIPGVLAVEAHMTYLEVLWNRDADAGSQIVTMGVALLTTHFSWEEVRGVVVRSEEELDRARHDEGLPDWAWRIGRS